MSHRQAYIAGVGLPPLIALAGLIVLLAWSTLGDARPRASPEYLAEIRDRVYALPYAIGSAVGTDIEVVPAAVRMLKPNAILQRAYRDPVSGRSVSVVIVHCQDVRDLAGHYPPICYPSAGWTESPPREVAEFEISDLKIRATRYVFLRHRESSAEASRLLSFFIMPNADSIAPSMDAVMQAARSPRAAGLGAAHVLLVAPETQPLEITDLMMADIIHELAPAIRAILTPSVAKRTMP
jgi:hypothetical protein